RRQPVRQQFLDAAGRQGRNDFRGCAPAPQPATPQPEPVAPAAGPERRPGAWQRFVRWWRGY
ncbi:cytochrome P450, partial [Streptomyces sp. YC419]|nr:cytochrome P450 [Streptomyces ureilyticus]